MGLGLRWRGKRTRVASPLLLIALAAACGDAPSSNDGQACSLNSDCDASQVCVAGNCHASCVEDRDCPTGARCVHTPADGNVCQLPNEATCTRPSDCAAG